MEKQIENMCRVFLLVLAILGIQEFQVLFHLKAEDEKEEQGREICDASPPELSCNSEYKYRSADGSCNNLNHPDWGRSYTAQRRFLTPKYDSDCNSPRQKGYRKMPLPSSREISNLLFQNRNSTTDTDPKLNVLHMSFGQFLDHDLILTPLIRGTFACCGEDRDSDPCIPITIPLGDPFFKEDCMPLTRSASLFQQREHKCCREQINDVTSYIDASNVYGSDMNKANRLRTFQNGTMRQRNAGLPDGGTSKCVYDDTTHEYCPNAGDVRVNVVPNLGSMHLLFVRYHNYIAKQLAAINPLWNDEILYQETRAIVSAITQHVVYSEYLPLVLGHDIMEQYKLLPKSNGHDTVYDEKVDASTRNSFGVAAFRFGHSQVTNHQKQFSKTYSRVVSKNIEDTYHHPHMCVEKEGKGSDGVLRWQLAEGTAKTDGVFESGVRDKLFMDSAGRSLDLPAINLQRGRDHGIPPYWKWRKFCGLNHKTFSDHNTADELKLQNIYRNLENVDLFAGAMTEKHVKGGVVGPTFACLIAKQFILYKKGDRFWYENDGYTGFTEDQLTEIKKVTLSSIICQTIEVDEITRHAFLVMSNTNPRVKCNNLTHPIWSPWRNLS
ncbi:peroxidase-like protein [Saccostrea echinata]|uniref:peroxidase-like protein n=1 Tax=Saccostrea echinata TaxID=191078 RepID=UPI002A7FBCEE|nr:peroxidase-like protein [Saccostrea echinata]